MSDFFRFHNSISENCFCVLGHGTDSYFLNLWKCISKSVYRVSAVSSFVVDVAEHHGFF